MTEGEAIHSLAALAQETRLRVFRHLVTAEPAGATPGQLAEALDRCRPMDTVDLRVAARALVDEVRSADR